MLEGKRRAIVIGINQYEDDAIPPLTGAENDAREIYQRLRDPNIGNFEIADHHYLLGAQATSARIRKAVSDVFWQTDACDLALFYFSGHGFVDGYDDGYIAPYDMRKDEPFVCGANMSELKRVLSRSENASAILVLDCCYSGVATRDKALSDYRAKYEANLENLSEGRIVLASSTPDQVSREIVDKHDNEDAPHPHGAFTYQLLRAMDGGASDEHGLISLLELRNYLEKQFQGKKGQTPRFFAEGSNLSAIKLAIATAKYNQNIEAKIATAKIYLEQRSFSSLVQAAKEVSAVLTINSKHKEAIALRGAIVQTLDDHRNRMMNWLTENELNIRPRLPVVFPEFDPLVDKLDFDSVATITGRHGNLLVLVSKVTLREVDNETFINRCKPFDNSGSRPQAIAPGASR